MSNSGSISGGSNDTAVTRAFWRKIDEHKRSASPSPLRNKTTPTPTPSPNPPEVDKTEDENPTSPQT